jgi:hypothetical protein
LSPESASGAREETMDKPGHAAVRGGLCMVALLLAWPVVAAELAEGQSVPPDPEFLEFLGETSGVSPELVAFMESPDAKRAIKDAARETPEKTDPVDAAQAQPAGSGRFIAVGAERWQSMNDTDRAAARARFETWRQLPPDERATVRERWKRFREFTPEQQGAVRQAYREFLELPPERRDGMSERWRRMSPEEQRRAVQRRDGGPKPGAMDTRSCPPC